MKGGGRGNIKGKGRGRRWFIFTSVIVSTGYSAHIMPIMVICQVAIPNAASTARIQKIYKAKYILKHNVLRIVNI